MSQTSDTGENKLSCTCQKLFGACRKTVKADYDVKIETYPDESCEAPTCSHSFKGSMKHNMLRVALAVGACIAVASILKMIIGGCCSLLGKDK